MICKRHEIKTGGQLSYQEIRVISKVSIHAEHNSFVKIPTNKVTCELGLELMVLLLRVMLLCATWENSNLKQGSYFILEDVGHCKSKHYMQNTIFLIMAIIKVKLPQ